MNKVVCRGCGAEKKFKNPNVGCFNVGETEKATGLKYVILGDVRHCFLCPDCYTKAKDLVKSLCAIVKDTDVHLRSFLDKK